MKFNNLKIKTKLLSCFIAMAIFTGVVGAVGVLNMSHMYENTKSMYEEYFIPAQDLSTVQVQLEQIRALHIYLLYDPDLSKQQERLDQIQQKVESDNALLDKFEKTITADGEDRKMFDKAITSLNIYRDERTKNLDLIINGNTEEAVATLSNVTKSREQAAADFQELINYNMNSSKEKLDSIKANYDMLVILMTVILLVAIAIALALGFAISSLISKPIKKMVNAADKLALGDVNANLDINSKDEIGSLAKSFNTMIDNIRDQARTTERIADGDLTVEVEVRSENDLLGKKLAQMVQNNNEVLSNIATASEQVAVGARQVSDSSLALSQGASEQASSVEELTASLQEIASQTEINAQNANQANELSENAKVNAVDGNSQMKEMLKAMKEINESSANISKVIKVIDDIAFQTNILALNAAVEAARAGQHGKGFAVVAEEVRNLAARSANAAKETTDMIAGSIKKAEDGTKIAQDTANALDKIVVGIEKVADLVSNIAVASNEQAMGISQINQGIMQVSNVVQTNSATSEESASASEELSSQAALLKDTVSKFKLKSTTRSYGNYENISPEVLAMLENMNAHKKDAGNLDSSTYKESTSKPKIILSDKEFGKY